MSNDKINYDKMYNAWRKSEGYQLPMTQEGVEKADHRWKGFQKGYEYGLRQAMLELEREHIENKHIHKFYLLAKEVIDKLRKGL